MKKLIEYPNYRAYLNDLIYGDHSKRGLQTELAKAMGCQASYLSQVLKEKAELTEDHGIKLAQHLRFSEFDCEYFLLLLRISRAATPDLLKHLEKQKIAMVQSSVEHENKIKDAKSFSSEKFLLEYYSTWIPSTIHISTGSERFRTPASIAKRLNLSLECVEQTLRFLEQAKLVEDIGGQFQMAGGSVHLPRTSPLNQVNQTNRRLQALRSIQENNKENLHFNSIFTSDLETFTKLRKMISQYIEQSNKLIPPSPGEEVYGMCLDLFQIA